MGNLFASLLATAGSMRVFERGFTVVQNNVANAATPGYAKQIQGFIANSFQPERGLPGGVTAGELISMRDAAAERAVRSQQSGLGYWEQRAAGLTLVEPVFDIAPEAGIHGMISRFFQTVAQWSVAPNHAASRQLVLDGAAETAREFNQAAAGLQNAIASANLDLRDRVDDINRIVNELAAYNRERRANFEVGRDPGLDARIHAALEELADLAGFAIIEAPDGTQTILLAGQTPVLVGDHVFPISLNVSAAGAAIADAQGAEITQQIRSGRLGALLEARNSSLPAYLQDLNRLAAAFGGQVNAVLAGGLDASGSAPPLDLFGYNPIDPAGTLIVNALAPGDLAAAAVGAPGGNGNALKLAQLAAGKQIDGLTYAEFVGGLSARVGQDLKAARGGQETAASLAAQARNIRDRASRVSLDEEAVHLVEFQRSYEASARLIQVISEMTSVTINLLR